MTGPPEVAQGGDEPRSLLRPASIDKTLKRSNVVRIRTTDCIDRWARRVHARRLGVGFSVCHDSHRVINRQTDSNESCLTTPGTGDVGLIWWCVVAIRTRRSYLRGLTS